MAFSHALHLAAILWVAFGWPDGFETDAVTVVGGGLGFVLLFAMAATSTDAAVAALGRARWKALHATGMWVVWFIFLVSYGPRALDAPAPLPVAATLALVALPALRVAARRRLARPAAEAA